MSLEAIGIVRGLSPGRTCYQKVNNATRTFYSL